MFIFEYINVNSINFNIIIENMKDRIIQIMEQEGMTSARFADSIGVQRAIMSHILSGRNNPSLDVLLKIITRFDYLSTDWVLFGKEPMFKHQQQLTKIEDEEIEDDISFSLIDQENEECQILSQQEEENNDKEEKIHKRSFGKPSIKSVTKIVVFYYDNTFENFLPERHVRK